MSEEMVIRCCAPTLAAIKTGSLFSCPFGNRAEMTESLRTVNRCLVRKGVCVLPLRWRKGKALLFLYRPQMLENDLGDPLAEDILRTCGYPDGSTAGRLLHLIHRLREQETFPHEIGLFLGYPPEDVRGFMDKKHCKCTGLWKVFESNVAEAERYFERCRNCTRIYLQCIREGWSLSRLTIPSRQFSYKTNPDERKENA